MAEAARRFVTFRLARRLYALSAEGVAEVIRLPSLARVPLTPKALMGIANLRGSVLPVVGTWALLDLDQPDASADGRAIVLDGTVPVALAVDAVEALVTVAVDRIETRQAELAVEPGEKVTGAFAVDGAGVAKILDIKPLLEKAFAERAQPRTRTALRSSVGAQNKEAAAPEDSEALVTFEVAGQEYALSLSAVQEIVPVPETVTPLPKTESLVVGVMPFRDRLLPLLSLRGLLGFARDAVPDAREKVVVTRIGDATVGLVADRARAVLSAPRALIEPLPAVLAARSGGETQIKAIYRGAGGSRLVSVLAPERLFREEIMQRLGSGTDAAPAKQENAATDERKFLVFRLGGDEFGLPIECVDEVARVPEQVTRVPKTPKFLEGVVNLRGEVLPVVDQRKRFDMPGLEDAENRRLIVVRTERHRAGVIVDSVSEVLRSTDSAIEPPPDLTGDVSRLVRGVINLEAQGRIVLLLDPAELLTRAERGLLDAFERKAKAAS
ncbi:MAG TPA: chemotaxis protein CheW [Rhizomicrobium sp.]|nr:chemotaxis protein CheW [Rhizomicrobium sp.]